MVTLEELSSDPHPVLAELRPVGWVDALGGWVVSSRELALRVMRDPSTFTVDDPRFSTAQVVGPSMLSLDDSAHAGHRAPFEHPFSLAQTRARFTTFVEEETDRLLSSIRQLGSADLRRTVAGPLSVAVVAYSLGLPPTSAATVLEWYEAISTSVTGVSAGHPVTAEGAAAFALLHKHVAGGIDRSDSLIAEAAHAGLGTDDVVANAAVLMFGGIETTEGMITNALWHLLTNRSQLGLVLADPTLLPNAIEESLRLEPAAAVVDRYAPETPNWPAPPSAGATLSPSPSPAPAETRRSSPIPTATTYAGPTRAAISPSPAVHTSASACTSPAWRPSPP